MTMSFWAAVRCDPGVGNGGKAQSKLLYSGEGGLCPELGTGLLCGRLTGGLWSWAPPVGDSVPLLAGVNSLGRRNFRSARSQR
jgi:hypothetical protein